MHKRPVTQYICDFCNKRGLSAASMSKHERHCTMNPNRQCRMCSTDRNLPELIKLLPVPRLYETEYGNKEFASNYIDELAAAVKKLDEVVDGCPACMLAAIRQAKIPVPAVPNFSFTERCKEFWQRVNEQEWERQHAY